jgi:hypothetical protein
MQPKRRAQVRRARRKRFTKTKHGDATDRSLHPPRWPPPSSQSHTPQAAVPFVPDTFYIPTLCPFFEQTVRRYAAAKWECALVSPML